MEKNQTTSGFLSKILGWSDPGISQATRKKNRKKSGKIRLFSKFFGRYLVKAKVYQRWQRQFFAKKVKKIPPMGRFLERYLFGDDRDFCWIVKKLKKVQNFPATLDFFWKILIRGQKRDQQYFPCREGKKWEKWKKIRPLSDFRRRYLFGAIRWQL